MSFNPLPLILLPGALCDETLFQPQVAHFSADRPVLVGDFSDCDSIQKMAKKILRAAPDTFALAGLSMGGIVAFEIMRCASERVERLALLDTNPRAESSDRKLMRAEQMQTVEAGGVEALLYLVESFYFPRYVSPARLDDESLKGVVMAMARKGGLKAFFEQWQALLGRPDSGHILPRIQCPTLVLCGEHDAMCAPEVHRAMAQEIPDSSLQIVPGSGHLSTLEAPGEVNALLEGWLN